MHPPLLLTVSGSGSGQGTVTDSKQRISCSIDGESTSGTCSASFPFPGPWDTLTATATSGYLFSGWSGACTGVDLCAVNMFSSSNSVTASFAPTSTYTLTISGAGNGSGMVISTPTGIWCTVTAGETSGTCTAPFAVASAVRLKEIPDLYFGGWTGDCTGYGQTCSVTMTSNKNVTATFTGI